MKEVIKTSKSWKKSKLIYLLSVVNGIALIVISLNFFYNNETNSTDFFPYMISGILANLAFLYVYFTMIVRQRLEMDEESITVYNQNGKIELSRPVKIVYERNNKIMKLTDELGRYATVESKAYPDIGKHDNYFSA